MIMPFGHIAWLTQGSSAHNGYGWEGLRQVCATLLGVRHVPERPFGGLVYLGHYNKNVHLYLFYLHCHVSLASSRSLGRDWRHRSGRHRARWTDHLHHETLNLYLPTSRDRPFYGAMVERCDGPSWLYDDDDIIIIIIQTTCATVL